MQSGSKYASFTGFRDSDLMGLRELSSRALGKALQEGEMAVSGHNWGRAGLEGSHLAFAVDDKAAMHLSVLDVTQATVDNNDLRLELAADDLHARSDALAEITLFVPPGSEDHASGEEGVPPARVLLELLKRVNPDVEAAAGGESVAEFDETRVLAPRGNFKVELHLTFLKLVGAQDYLVRYSAVSRIFVLPKNPANQTAVVVSLDPPLRKGQTYYPHVLLQFPTEEEIELDLNISAEDLEAKRAKCDGKLDTHYDGKTFDIFSRVLRGLSASRIVKPSQFRSALDESAYSIRCIYKADNGLLFPLERGFFFIDKPPILILFDDISECAQWQCRRLLLHALTAARSNPLAASVEFARQAQDVASRSSRTFDLVVHLRSGQEHQFRSIAREEWSNLLDFMEAKKIRVEDLAQAKAGPGAGAAAALRDLSDEDEEDEDEEDDDFKAGAVSCSGSWAVDRCLGS